MIRLARAAAVLALAGAAACASGLGSDELLRRFPELGRHPGQRLADLHPVVLPSAGVVSLLTCRWSTGAPIPVAVALDASDDEREAVDAVLRAWERAGLGVRFVRVDGDDSSISIRFEDEPVQTPAGPDTGNTIADCRIAPLSESRGTRPVRGAELVSARIRIARTAPSDFRTENRPLTGAELRGVLLHEIGHALGFQGHVGSGDSVMVRELEKVRRAGTRLREHRDATLAALYALPSGAVLRQAAIERWRGDLVDRMARLAEANDLEGPYLRAGETAARIWWVDAKGRDYGLVVVNLQDTIRDPAEVLVVPEPRTRRALPRYRDLVP